MVLYENPRTEALDAPPSDTIVPLNVAPVLLGVTLSVVTVGGVRQIDVVNVMSDPFVVPTEFVAHAR